EKENYLNKLYKIDSTSLICDSIKSSCDNHNTSKTTSLSFLKFSTILLNDIDSPTTNNSSNTIITNKQQSLPLSVQNNDNDNYYYSTKSNSKQNNRKSFFTRSKSTKSLKKLKPLVLSRHNSIGNISI